MGILKRRLRAFCTLEVCKFTVCLAVRQEQELRNGSPMDKKLSTLADLFRPPIELMHKGSFETVSVVFVLQPADGVVALSV